MSLQLASVYSVSNDRAYTRSIDHQIMAKRLFCSLGFTGTRPGLALLGRDIQIDRSNQLEVGVVFRVNVSFLLPVVTPDELANKYLDFKQCKVEADTHPRTSTEAIVAMLARMLHWMRTLTYGTYAALCLCFT